MKYAYWISDPTYSVDKKTSPAPFTFRRRFPVGGKVKKATLEITAMGIYTVILNGRRVEDFYFAPYYTSYPSRLQVQTLDLSALLEEDNVLDVVVGAGWAAGRYGLRNRSQLYEKRQSLLAELTVEYEDGTLMRVPTDRNWKVTQEGNYRFADWYDGEIYDATVDPNALEWKNVKKYRPADKPELLPQYGEYVRVRAELAPVSHFTAPNGEEIYDFGQNFSGVIRAKLRGAAGQTVVFRHAEVLRNGRLFVKSLRTAKATATYVCRDGEQEYSPRLTSMGFRYVGVRGVDPGDLELSAYVLYSDFDEIGSFECGNDLLNRLQQNIVWSGRSNFADIPTDCPQRDERLGWTGDIALFASTACFNFDLGRFFGKWLRDLASEQNAGGGLPFTVPDAGVKAFCPTACWGDACVLVPWAQYLAQGDKEFLAAAYPAAYKFMKSVRRWAAAFSFGRKRYIWKLPFSFGDWCAPGENITEWRAKGPWINTCYFANSCGLMEKMARELGKEKDAEYFAALRAKIVDAFRKEFTDGEGTLRKEFQTGYVLPLYFGMAEGDERKKMAENLDRLVREAGYHLTTGFTGTPYLLFALADNGYLETAYRVLLQEDCPSWLYEVKAGATTIWERWDALRPDGTVNLGRLSEAVTAEDPDSASDDDDDDTGTAGMVSFNHYANGAVGDFLYRRVAGLEALEPGYRRFRVRPMPGANLSFAKASTRCPYGTVEVAWEVKAGNFTLNVTVPEGTEAEVLLPNGEEQLLGAGRHELRCFASWRKRRIVENDNREIAEMIREGLKKKEGYCPCRLAKTEENKCMCREFREQIADPAFEGLCHCRLYKKYYED